MISRSLAARDAPNLTKEAAPVLITSTTKFFQTPGAFSPSFRNNKNLTELIDDIESVTIVTTEIRQQTTLKTLGVDINNINVTFGKYNYQLGNDLVQMVYNIKL